MSLSGTVNSLVDNEALIKKVYFPREIVPLSIILGNLVNFLISNFVILMFMFLMKIELSKFLLLLPFVILLQTIFVTGLALIFSALQVHYRDVKYIVEVLLIFWFYISPIFYPLRLVRDVSENFLRVYLWNPLAHMITLYRLVYLKGYWKVLPEGFSIPFSIIYSSGISLLVFILGFLAFRRLQRFFTDYL
jgi:ABC-2 type transport system permease protein